MSSLKAAWRSLASTPGATLVVVLTLAIAIGANAAIFSVVNGVLLQPFGYVDDDRLVVLWASSGSDSSELFRLSPADYRDARDAAESFDGQVVLYRFIGSTITGLDRPVRVGSLSVTPRLFGVLGARPAAGSFFTDADEKPGSGKKVVLTHASWVRRFGGDPSVIGSTLELDSQPYTVVGVAGPDFTFPPGNDEVELYFPMTLSDAVLLDRSHRMFDAVARLANGVDLEKARGELAVIGERLAREFPDTNAGWALTARPLREELVGDLDRTLWLLSGAVFLVLLIACANIANVLIARSIQTSRELALRAALGARSTDLLRRSFAESALLGGAGGAVGVLLALGGVRVLRVLIPADIPRGSEIALDARVLLFALAASLGATLLFGVLPALRSMAPDVLDVLRPARAFGSRLVGGGRLRELLVVAEFALAVVLMVGAGLMVRSFIRLNDVDPGFRRSGVVSVAVSLPPTRYGRDERRAFFERALDRLRELPGVEAAGAVSDLPMSSVGLGFEMEFTVPGLDAVSPSARPNADFRLVLPGYFDAMGMRVVKGRDLDARDVSSAPVRAVVNETLVARYFGELDPIGRTLRVQNLGESEIVGVVSDVRHEGLQSKHESEIYLPYGRPSTAEMHLVVHSALDTPTVARAVGGVLVDMDSELAPSSVAALGDLLWQSVARPRFNTSLLVGLALCAALLAIVGTYGIVSYSVSQRTAEIGVRMALGADAAATRSMIVGRALAIVGAGTALGLAGALGASRLLDHLLYEVPPTDPLTYAFVLVAAAAIGIVAAWTPARRATRIDPVVALRND